MNTVSEFEAISLIQKWGQLFDNHASPKTIYRFVADEDFTIRFGDTIMRGLGGLEEHHPLKEMFTREIHHYYDFQVEKAGPPLVMRTQMVWDTYRVSETGSPEHLIADLRHRWAFTRNQFDEPVFLTHELLELNYRPNFAPSVKSEDNLHIDSKRVGFGK